MQAVTKTGRHIGTYSLSEAMLLFKGAASVHNGKVVIDEKRCGEIDERNGWRTIREHDGTDSYWNASAFEERFGIAFALNIKSMHDVRRFAKLAERAEAGRLNRASLAERSHDIKERSAESAAKAKSDEATDKVEAEPKIEPKDKYAHPHTRQIPPALGYHWIWEGGKIYCVDDDGRRISESYLDAEIEVYWEDEELERRASPSGPAEAGREQTNGYIHSRERPIPAALKYRWVIEDGNTYCVDRGGRKITERKLKSEIDSYRMKERRAGAAATRETSEQAELRRRNEEIMDRAMREHCNDYLKPAGWKATQRFNEEKAKEKERESQKRKRQEAAERKAAGRAKKKAAVDAGRRAEAKAVNTDSDTPTKASANATARKTAPSMTDKQCLVKALSSIADPFVAEAVKSMFHSIGMMGIVERALMLLRGEPREDKPASLDLYATENAIRYRYCKTDRIRLYCFCVIADAIARKVSDANAEGPEPYIWALENAKGKQGARKRAAMSILNDTEHLILFSDDIVQKASSCIDELTILPYPTTLVRIEGLPNTWGAVAYESSNGIEIATIGERSCGKAARCLLAYIENHCSAQSYDGYKVDFETAAMEHETDSVHFAEPTVSLPASVDQRTHVIKAETKKKARLPQARRRKAPDSVAPYTRRGHWRHQHYGKGNSQVKLIQIAPTFVKPRGDGAIPFGQRVHVVV